jgi:hypothetical protein
LRRKNLDLRGKNVAAMQQKDEPQEHVEKTCTCLWIRCGLPDDRQRTGDVFHRFKLCFIFVGGPDVSLLQDFARMRLYRTRASEFELLAETEPLPEARLRYRVIARHYRELADREEQSDKARMAEHLKMLKLKRREAAE